MKRWLQYNEKPATPPHEDDLVPILQKAKENVDRKWAKGVSRSTSKLSDFELIKTLGEGTFGKVMLARSLLNRKFCAIKIMAKKAIIQDNHLEQVIMEKRILSVLKFPFLVEYLSHFKDNANVYLVLEFAPGGDIHHLLRKLHRFDEELTKFYAAQVVLALEYLHFVGIIYRDVKPENLVIDGNGYIKVTDFGYAKKIDKKRTKTICGTPEYYAPEIIKGLPYSYPVDWYALGILIYEMSEGHPPFKSTNTLRLFETILHGHMKFPPFFTENTVSIVKGLTKHVSSLRLTNPKIIKRHQFFTSINWLQIYWKTAHPPYAPEVRGENDTRNFERHEEKPIVEESEEIYKKEFDDF